MLKEHSIIVCQYGTGLNKNFGIAIQWNIMQIKE